MSGKAPLLRIEGLSVSYRDGAGLRQAVRHLDLELSQGEVLGLVGESGSGKSTVALAVAGYLGESGGVTAGSIFYNGIDLARLSPRQRRQLCGREIAVVYQDPAGALNPTMRVGEQIAEAFRLQFRVSRTEARKRATESLARVSIPDPAAAYRRYPYEFSGGQQQRIVIAMALAGNPRLLILDEPTTGLDATVEAGILDLFRDLKANLEAGLLFISHDITLIEQMCDRVGVLYGGLLVETGPTAEVLSRPRHPYTAMLLSCLIPAGARKGGWHPPENPGHSLVVDVEGCPFRSRCPIARPACAEGLPAIKLFGADHAARCPFGPTVPSLREEAEELASIGWAEEGRQEPVHRETVLRVSGAGKDYAGAEGTFTAVRSASLTMVRATTLAVVGESGSGKTTLAKLIAGLLPLDRGHIEALGQDATQPVEDRSAAQRRAIQMVFQNPDQTLNPRRRVGSLLMRTAMKLAGLDRRTARARALDLLQAVRLQSGVLDCFPAALSGGQRQRVAIARAFIGGPQIVLCDEPTSALDLSVRAAILELLVKLQETTGSSYLYISHDIASVRYLADAVMVMYRGRIVAAGRNPDIFQAPLHPYVEELLAAVRHLGAPLPHRARRDPVASSPVPARQGCPFSDRCRYRLGPECETDPPWQAVGERYRYQCFIPPDRLAELQKRAIH